MTNGRLEAAQPRKECFMFLLSVRKSFLKRINDSKIDPFGYSGFCRSNAVTLNLWAAAGRLMDLPRVRFDPTLAEEWTR